MEISKPSMPAAILAIDGPAASGKGTLARNLAAHLGFAHLDTGALYRAVGLHILRCGDDPADTDTAQAAATYVSRQISVSDDPSVILSDPAIKADETGQAASKVAAVAQVRQSLLLLQRMFALSPPQGARGAVLDGRDIGTVICPAAPIKLFVTADVEIRAQRRAKELQSLGKEVTYKAVLADMRERDTRDADRHTAPMMTADDAVVIQTDTLNADQAFETALNVIRDVCPHWIV